jgi:hypothetical protein
MPTPVTPPPLPSHHTAGRAGLPITRGRRGGLAAACRRAGRLRRGRPSIRQRRARGRAGAGWAVRARMQRWRFRSARVIGRRAKRKLARSWGVKELQMGRRGAAWAAARRGAARSTLGGPCARVRDDGSPNTGGPGGRGEGLYAGLRSSHVSKGSKHGQTLVGRARGAAPRRQGFSWIGGVSRAARALGQGARCCLAEGCMGSGAGCWAARQCGRQGAAWPPPSAAQRRAPRRRRRGGSGGACPRRKPRQRAARAALTGPCR